MDPKNILRLARIRQRFEKFLIAAFKETPYKDMAPAHAAIAATLSSQGPLTMSDLALWVEKRKPTVTVLVTKLQKFKLVKCEKDGYDQRITRVHLTEEGEAFARLTNKLALDIIAKSTDEIPEENLAVFSEVLTKMLKNLEDYR